MYAKTAFLKACLFIFCSVSFGFAGEFSGQVNYSGSGIPGASISLSQGGENFSTVSGKAGAFSIKVPDGTYKVTVTMGGFRTLTEEGVAIGAGGATRDFDLEAAQFEELVVVSSSKVETKLLDSPATISVVTSAAIENSTADDFGDIMREVPGVNVTQFSARDINIVSREEAKSLSNSQLALLDGRTIYLDFFGIVLWDLVPTNLSEIKQIEVVRGPASAIWGANAQTGLINIISKSPRELVGTSITLNAGIFDREVKGGGSAFGDGKSYGFSLTHAAVVNDTWSYKLSLGYFESDSWARPNGIIPVDPVRGTGGFPYPPFQNQGSEQPKIDFRLDQELSNGGRITYGAGQASTQGIIHSGIGPFDIQDSTGLSYGKVNYSKNSFKLNFFANILDGDAVNLLTAGPDGNPIDFSFKTETYDLEVGNSNSVGEHHIFTYGGNVRSNSFDLSIAPGEDKRNEYGGYVQDEIVLDKFRAVLGVRFDKFDSIDDVVTSPRLTFMYQPNDQHTFRASYNEAFRAPSLIENYLDVVIVAATLDLGLLNPALAGQMFPIITSAFGNRDLVEDSLTAYELSYTGRVGNGLLGIAYYRNETDNNLNFVNPADGFYSSANPPPGWVQAGLPPQVLDLLLANGIRFPSYFTYQNLGPVTYEGLELSLDYTLTPEWSFNVNYSYQDDPKVESSANPFPESELSLPASNRYNLGISYNGNRLSGDLSFNHTDDTFSTDVLDSRFHGLSPAFDLLNLAVGYKWLDNRLQAKLKVTNLTNEEIQQHIFADIMKRNIVAELTVHF